jgi:hypothetical protein
MRILAAIVVAVAALVLLLPASAGADPGPLWKSFPLGRQPLIDRQSGQAPAGPPAAAASRDGAAAPRTAPAQARPGDSSVADTLVLVVSAVLGVSLLLAMIAVLASPRLINRRTS